MAPNNRLGCSWWPLVDRSAIRSQVGGWVSKQFDQGSIAASFRLPSLLPPSFSRIQLPPPMPPLAGFLNMPGSPAYQPCRDESCAGIRSGESSKSCSRSFYPQLAHPGAIYCDTVTSVLQRPQHPLQWTELSHRRRVAPCPWPPLRPPRAAGPALPSPSPSFVPRVHKVSNRKTTLLPLLATLLECNDSLPNFPHITFSLKIFAMPPSLLLPTEAELLCDPPSLLLLLDRASPYCSSLSSLHACTPLLLTATEPPPPNPLASPSPLASIPPEVGLRLSPCLSLLSYMHNEP